MIKEIEVSTKDRYEMVDITNKVEETVAQTEIKDGLAFVFTPHSTAGILLTENEAGLIEDWLEVFKKITFGLDFQHNRIDNNADSHILSGLLGQGRILLIEGGRLVRGAWQNIFLAEFDGPRTRRIIIKILKT